MIRPAPALVWLVGLCSAPLGIGAAVWPELLPLVALAVFLLAVVCAVDAWFGRERLEGMSAFSDDDGQMAQAREAGRSVEAGDPGAGREGATVADMGAPEGGGAGAEGAC